MITTRKVNVITRIFLFLVILLFSCQQSQQDDEELLPDEPFEAFITTSLELEYGCTNTLYDMDVDIFTGNPQHIRSKEQFDLLVTGTCLPEIDFDNYDLVIGKRQFAFEVDTVSHYPLKTSDGTVIIVFEVRKGQDLLQEKTIVYHALITKIRE
ncbi:MAG: hypothetical protein AAF740_08325, partial [Bacteroidota bacterium]